MLAAIPLLSLFGLFGERTARRRAASAKLELAATFPERFRYRQSQPLEVIVRNLSQREIDTVHVSIDTAYLSRFTDVRITPSPRIAYIVDILHVRPGESRLVALQIGADRYGWHHGWIAAIADGDSIAIPIRTLVFP